MRVGVAPSSWPLLRDPVTQLEPTTPDDWSDLAAWLLDGLVVMRREAGRRIVELLVDDAA